MIERGRQDPPVCDRPDPKSHSSAASGRNAWSEDLVARWLLPLINGGVTENAARIDAGFGAGLIAIVILLFWRTWAVWPNLQIDCGREMYVPAQMALGKHLYGDLWFQFGPLAPTVNSALFRLFGTHLNTLYFTGLVISCVSTLLLYTIARRLSTPLVGGAFAFCFCISLFSPSLFNYILPYSYSATYGATFLFVELYFLLRWVRREAGPSLFIAACCAALAALTKFEYGMVCYLCFALACVMRGLQDRSWRTGLLALSRLLPGLVAVAATYGWLIHKYTLAFLIRANWIFPGSYFVARFGKRWVTNIGLRFDPSEIAVLCGTALVSLAAWSLVILCLHSRWWWLFAVITAAAVLVPDPLFPTENAHALSALNRLFATLRFPSGVFMVAMGLTCWSLAEAWRRRSLASSMELLIACFFALAIGIRCFAVGRLIDYNLYYSPLVFLLFLVALWKLVVLFTRAANARDRAFTMCRVFALQLFVFAQAMLASYPSLTGTSFLRSPFGEVRVSPIRAQLLPQVMALMQRAKQKHQEVLLLPEYAGLYFLTGTACPSRFYVLSPGSIEPGEYLNGYLHSLDTRKPEWVVLSNRATLEYGVPYFGIDYYPEVLSWIERHYTVDGEIGHFNRDPNGQEAFLVYRLKS